MKQLECKNLPTIIFCTTKTHYIKILKFRQVNNNSLLVIKYVDSNDGKSSRKEEPNNARLRGFNRGEIDCRTGFTFISEEFMCTTIFMYELPSDYLLFATKIEMNCYISNFFWWLLCDLCGLLVIFVLCSKLKGVFVS
ncbi:hypothetical protein J1N35_014115 [Gossypium stocksii]|uniref:Uncharacterized protein n=1 Tax=Gossypium stocksii TaxID=47602 RepID=A0A9D3VVE8_9ROSI|nr:hypothetical protein J1N35_014115 [Gossypium stocksii]